MVLVRNLSSRLAGKTALITGASSGIGRSTAYELAYTSEGKIRLILGARRIENLEKIRADLLTKYPAMDILPKQLDVSKHKEIPAFVDSLPKDWTNIDILINNAGLVFGNEQVGNISPEDIDVMFNTNVLGLIALTQQLIPMFKVRGNGDVVNIGSIAGVDPYPGGAIYCATKAALRSFTHSLRKETIDTRIRVIEIDPGAVETEFSIVRNRGDREKAKAVYAGTEPLDADDVAELITFALTRRENTVIAEALIFPSHQASASHIFRKV